MGGRGRVGRSVVIVLSLNDRRGAMLTHTVHTLKICDRVCPRSVAMRRLGTLPGMGKVVVGNKPGGIVSNITVSMGPSVCAVKVPIVTTNRSGTAYTIGLMRFASSVRTVGTTMGSFIFSAYGTRTG